MQPQDGAQHITIDDTFQAWAEQEKLDANDRFFAMINGKVVDGEDPLVDQHVYFIPKLSAAVGKKKAAEEASDAEDRS